MNERMKEKVVHTMLLGVKTVPPGLKIFDEAPELAATLSPLRIIRKPSWYTEVYRQMGFFPAVLAIVTNHERTEDR